MAEKKSEFEQAIDDFYKACKAENWDEATEAGKRVKGHLANAPKGFNAEIFTNDLATAYGNRGRAYNHKGECDRAIDEYKKAIEKKPDFAEAYNNRGNAYADKGKYDRAITDYTKAIEIDPDDASLRVKRALIFNQLKNYNTALLDMKQAIQIEKKSGYP